MKYMFCVGLVCFFCLGSVNAYTINNTGGDSTFDTGTHANTTVKISTGVLQANWLVDNFTTYLSFDEPSGTFVIDQTTLNNGTIVNSPNAILAVGRYGNGILCNGDTGHATFPTTDFVDDQFGTLSAWVKFNKAVDSIVVGAFDTTSVDQTIGIGGRPDGEPAEIRFQSRDVAYDFIRDTTFQYSNDVWYHLLMKQNGVNPELYINGVNQSYANVLAANNKAAWFGDTATLNLASICRAVDTSPGSNLNGTVDEVMVFNHPLSDIQINQTRDNLHFVYSNWTSADVDAGAGNICNNFSVNFTDNEGTLDVWKNESGVMTLIQSQISSLTDYALGGSEQFCGIRLSFNSSNQSLTPEVSSQGGIKVNVAVAAAGNDCDLTTGSEWVYAEGDECVIDTAYTRTVGDIHVRGGSTIFLDGVDLYMPSGSKLILEDGGKFVVRNGIKICGGTGCGA